MVFLAFVEKSSSEVEKRSVQTFPCTVHTKVNRNVYYKMSFYASECIILYKETVEIGCEHRAIFPNELIHDTQYQS